MWFITPAFSCFDQDETSCALEIYIFAQANPNPNSSYFAFMGTLCFWLLIPPALSLLHNLQKIIC